MKERMRFVTDWERDLRLNEIGMIKSSPQKILDQSTDWRFLNELKRELKG